MLFKVSLKQNGYELIITEKPQAALKLQMLWEKQFKRSKQSSVL